VCRKFGQTFANGLRRHRARPGDKWHLDEVFIKIGGKTLYRSRTWFRGVARISLSGSGGVVVFVDDTAEYSVASDRPVDRYGDGPPVVIRSVLASGLVGPMVVVVPRVLRRSHVHTAIRASTT
jgi:hypothetical protein